MHKNHNAMLMINGCMDTYMHKTMASIASLEKIEIIRSQECMPSEARVKFLKKMIILGSKTAILGPQFCRILVLGPHQWTLQAVYFFAYFVFRKISQMSCYPVRI